MVPLHALRKCVELPVTKKQMLPLVHHRPECKQGRVSGIYGDGIDGLEKSIQAFTRLPRCSRQTNSFGADLEHDQAGVTRWKPAERTQERRLTVSLQPEMGGAIFRYDQSAEKPSGDSVLRDGLRIAEDSRPDSRHCERALARCPCEQVPFTLHESRKGFALSPARYPWLTHEKSDSISVPTATFGVPGE